MADSSGQRSLSLTQQNAWRLAMVFMAFEIMAALAVVFLMMLPMARRAAGDLAGIMVLSAQTLSELPPETRPVFVRELKHSHQLALASLPPEGPRQVYAVSPFLSYLDDALSRRLGSQVDMASVLKEGDTWHWARLPSGPGYIWIGFSHGRLGPQPMVAVLITLAIGLGLAVLAAWWLARRTVAPLHKLDAAAASLGRGEFPALLSESGPRELAALAHRFNALAGQVRDLLEARTTLLAGLSHDLRTPLARMRLALEMLERRPDPAWIKRLDNDIGEMDRLVGELLDLARGFGREEATRIDIHAVLVELAARSAQQECPVTVHGPSMPWAVPAASLRRVLSNLLENACRYADGAIELHLEPTDGGCRIGILDNGPGIPADQLEAVFRPFHRVEGSRSSATGGTGLGLAIVRQLAQANGWRVALENRKEGGLAAWIHLPAALS